MSSVCPFQDQATGPGVEASSPDCPALGGSAASPVSGTEGRGA